MDGTNGTNGTNGMDAATEGMLESFRGGQLGVATQQAARLVRQDPRNLAAWRVLGHVKQFQGRLSEARACAARALEIAPADPESRVIAAGVEGALGRTEEAIAHCDRALASEPGMEAALSAKAGFLERAGRTEEALALVDGLGEPRPAAAEITAVRALQRLGRHGDALERADAALTRGGASDRRRYHLCMLRAKSLDALGRYGEALDAALEGNAAALPEDADPGGYARLADAALGAYTAESVGSMPVNATGAGGHVFIAGFPRTGTTLVEQILDAHPDAQGVGEAKEIDLYTRGLQQQLGAFVPYPEAAAHATPEVLSAYANHYENALREHGFDPGLLNVNKNLRNLLHVGFIAQVFPAARFVLTRRDPRDTAVSCLMGLFRPEAMPELFTTGALAESLRAADRLRERWLELYPDRTLEVVYEDLVRDHEGATRRLVEFAGLGWDDRCLRFYESGRTVMTLAYDQVNRPVYDSSVGRHGNYAGRLAEVEELGP